MSGTPSEPAASAAAAIELADVSVRRGGRTILGPLDWTIRRGERWVVLGPNGSGKSTLLQVLNLALWPTTGTVHVLGERFGRVDAREHRRRIGYAGSLDPDPEMELSPFQLVLSARHAALAPWWHTYDDADRARATGLIERLGLGHVATQSFRTLSSGERRRVSIARALMPEPELVLLDEPGGGLDLGARETLIRDLEALAADAALAAIVLVSHHVEEIPRGFGHGLLLRDGRVLRAGPIEAVVDGGPLGAAYDMPIVVDRRDGRFSARRTEAPPGDTRSSR